MSGRLRGFEMMRSALTRRGMPTPVSQFMNSGLRDHLVRHVSEDVAVGWLRDDVCRELGIDVGDDVALLATGQRLLVGGDLGMFAARSGIPVEVLDRALDTLAGKLFPALTDELNTAVGTGVASTSGSESRLGSAPGRKRSAGSFWGGGKWWGEWFGWVAGLGRRGQAWAEVERIVGSTSEARYEVLRAVFDPMGLDALSRAQLRTLTGNGSYVQSTRGSSLLFLLVLAVRARRLSRAQTMQILWDTREALSERQTLDGAEVEGDAS